MKYLVDTDWIIDCLRGRKGPIGVLFDLAPEDLAVSIISAAKLYEGAYSDADVASDLTTVTSALRGFEVLTVSDPVARRFGQLRAEMRPSGRLPADFDLLIGATAVEFGLTLLTRNIRHFERIPGLDIYR